MASLDRLMSLAKTDWRNQRPRVHDQIEASIWIPLGVFTQDTTNEWKPPRLSTMNGTFQVLSCAATLQRHPWRRCLWWWIIKPKWHEEKASSYSLIILVLWYIILTVSVILKTLVKLFGVWRWELISTYHLGFVDAIMKICKRLSIFPSLQLRNT